jgi:hypothetical protein
MDSESLPQGGQEPVRRPDVEARKRDIARITSEIEEVRRQIQAERDLDPMVEKAWNEDPEVIEGWEMMSREEQSEWIGNLRKFVEEHREDLAEVREVGGLLDRLERISKHQDSLIRLEDEAQDLILQSHADEAEAMTRMIVAMAEIMRSMENFTEEEWQDIPPDNRAGMMDLLHAWQDGQREACLSQLPIEIRRRYE